MDKQPIDQELLTQLLEADKRDQSSTFFPPEEETRRPFALRSKEDWFGSNLFEHTQLVDKGEYAYGPCPIAECDADTDGFRLQADNESGAWKPHCRKCRERPGWDYYDFCIKVEQLAGFKLNTPPRRRHARRMIRAPRLLRSGPPREWHKNGRQHLVLAHGLGHPDPKKRKAPFETKWHHPRMLPYDEIIAEHLKACRCNHPQCQAPGLIGWVPASQQAIVIDEDSGKGTEAVRAIANALQALPHALAQSRRTGGYHIIYRVALENDLQFTGWALEDRKYYGEIRHAHGMAIKWHLHRNEPDPMEKVLADQPTPLTIEQLRVLFPAWQEYSALRAKQVRKS